MSDQTKCVCFHAPEQHLPYGGCKRCGCRASSQREDHERRPPVEERGLRGAVLERALRNLLGQMILSHGRVNFVCVVCEVTSHDGEGHDDDCEVLAASRALSATPAPVTGGAVEATRDQLRAIQNVILEAVEGPTLSSAAAKRVFAMVRDMLAATPIPPSSTPEETEGGRVDTFPPDFEVRTFGIKGARVHVARPGIHGEEGWRVYHYPEPYLFPCKVEYVESFEAALKRARELAVSNADADREFLRVMGTPEQRAALNAAHLPASPTKGTP